MGPSKRTRVRTPFEDLTNQNNTGSDDREPPPVDPSQRKHQRARAQNPQNSELLLKKIHGTTDQHAAGACSNLTQPAQGTPTASQWTCPSTCTEGDPSDSETGGWLHRNDAYIRMDNANTKRSQIGIGSTPEIGSATETRGCVTQNAPDSQGHASADRSI